MHCVHGTVYLLQQKCVIADLMPKKAKGAVSLYQNNVVIELDSQAYLVFAYIFL